MKKIILITAFLCGFIAANAQYTYIAQRYDWLAGLFRALGLPAGDSAQFQTSQRQRAGSIYYDSVGVDAGLYAWTGLTWQLIGSGGSQTLQEVFDTEPGGSILTKTDSILIPHTGNLRIYGQYVPLILESDSAQGIIVRTRHPQANLLFATKTSTDISTVTSEVTIQKLSTGTVTNGYGTRVRYDLESANGTGRMASEYQTIWSNATDANRTSFVRIRAMNNGIEDTVMDIQPDYIIVHNGDDSLATLADVRAGSGSGGTWGSITGTLSAQTDLQTALDAKQNALRSVTVSSSTSLTLSTANTYVFSGSSDATWTLPAGTVGLTYLIKSRGSAAVTLVGTLYTNTSVASLIILPGDAYHVQWDGTYYIVF